MELRHLRYFVAVAECKSFNAAAKRLFISQPPLSRQIKQLEDEIGIELINRNQRPLQLTEAGEFFYEHAVQILSKADNLKNMTLRMASFDDTISIGFVSSILSGFLPRIIASFRETHPNVKVKLHDLNSFEQTEALKEGRIDVGYGRLRLEDTSVRRIVLREEKLVAAIPITHHLANNPDRKLELLELVNEDLLLYPRRPRPSFLDQVLELFEQRNIHPKSYQEVRELQVVLGLVAAGEGISIVPETVSHVRSNEIVYMSFSDEEITSPIIMNIRNFDKSDLLSTLLKVTYENYDKFGFSYKKQYL